ncbi:hypothetical protein [Ancylomarina subtilis]|nr:hypothetical protein [Ancylomarina subtilis]
MQDYAKANPRIILNDLITSGDSFDWIPTQEGIKNSEKAIDLSDGATVIQRGDYTGTNNASGSTKLKDVDIKVYERFIKENYKSQDLQAKLSQLAMQTGSNPEDLPHKDAVVGLKKDSIKRDNEISLWVEEADEDGEYGDGFLPQILAGSGKNIPSTKLTSENAVETVEAFIEFAYAQNENFITYPTFLAMSPAQFTKYFRAVNKLNTAVDKLTNESGVVTSFVIPGTNITCRSVFGLTGKDNFIMDRVENFRIGLDGKSEEEQLTFEYHSHPKIHELFAVWKLGAKVIRPNETIFTKDAA